MHSSPSGSEVSNHSDAMFPETDLPGSAKAMDNPALFTTPPHLQELSDPTNQEALKVEDSGKEAVWSIGENSKGQKPAVSDEPGASWNNKKAIDDYRRAQAQIEDPSFTLRKCYYRSS